MGMARYVFILGKNPDLSLAELLCYFESHSASFSLVERSEYYAVLEAPTLPQGIMDHLGGTLKIGEVIFSTDTADQEKVSLEMESRINFGKLFSALPDKALLGISSYNSGDEQEFFQKFLRGQLKLVGLRPGFVHYPRGRFALTHTEFVEKKIASRGMELFLFGKLSLAETLFVHDPYEFRKRDMKRPVQRTALSIPPRLCKIMINLTTARDCLLLDPFCGMGAILQEAALMGFGIRGVDKEGGCVEGCIRNLAWLSDEYKLNLRELARKIRKGDASKLEIFFLPDSIGAIATEPYLGPTLDKRPQERMAVRIVEETEPLYRATLESMAKVLKQGGRIVMVTPSFRMPNGRMVRPDMKAMCESMGLVLVDPLEKYGVEHGFPLLDYDPERHNTIREINVIEKPGK